MKAPPAFQFFPADWLSSSKVQRMSNAAEGIYIRLICYQWMDGFIPDSVTLLARLCKISERKMKKLWGEVSPCFDLEIEPGKLANKRLEETRNQQLEYRAKQAEHGKHGAEIKKGSLEGTLPSTLKGKASTSPSSSPSSSREEIHNSKKIHSAGLKNAVARPRDLASDFYAEKCLELTGAPYVCERGDFVMLAKLRKGFGIEAREKPPGWDEAVIHYFGSPLSQYSLADLANPKRYAVFKNSPLDGFNKPTNHGNGNGNGKRESSSEARQRRSDESDKRVAAMLAKTRSGVSD